ncbi:putative phospholipid transporting ATPase-like protein [Leptomonas pyrrhocoris]|uniref:Putative phospholipid transporting ATPase-like protein n=1 Tax=Leptomonas pyrrhocoris TaxID=157538 RepID=A0A0N1J4K6_LEPPY|nr:putative phospholipid transporting ATPase-like protein [Leptomonas pyrrhocoris]KPA77602.1 putative phospholipid transporting ATPase-like protein [Leptomonas pyrrhocoris]|eukprot:XP_015656041.1 putative phospholipid transporting ATPase-like protein [Leptomonas pyrrhocoris]
MWRKVKSGFAAFTATASDTFGCTSNNGNAIDDDDDNNYVADRSDNGSSSQPGFVEVDLLRSDLNHQRKFPDNSIRTAKYTLASGLPLSLLYQFYKISNFYFLLVMVITLVPGASPINPFSSVVPLCIVLGAGIIKDLWEDWKRRKADQQANEMIVHVLRVPVQAEGSGRPARSGSQADRSPKPATSPPGAEAGHAEGSVEPLLRGDTAATKHNTTNIMTSDSEERHSSNGAEDASGNGHGRKRVVRFLFPADKTHPRGGGGGTEMASLDKSPRASPAAPPRRIGDGDGGGVVPPAPARSALLKPLAQNDEANSAATSQADAATAATTDAATSTSQEPNVTFQPIRSCDVYPGDVVLFRLGEEVRADCLLLNTSLPDGLTYIETANLDGETSAKTRRAKMQTVEALGTVEDIIERALGVPASSPAAVFAKMNGEDPANGSAGGSGEPLSKVTVDSCGGVAAHVATSPSQEADKAVAATANAQGSMVGSGPEGDTCARHSTPQRPPKTAAAAEEERRRLLSRSPEKGTRDGEDSHVFITPHLEPEEREAAEAGNGPLPGQTDVPHLQHRRFSDSLRQQQSGSSYRRPALSLITSGTDLAIPAESEPFFGQGSVSLLGLSADHTLDHLRHQRHMTLDERLVEEGTIPMPQHVRELSAQYERAHSRTNSLNSHLLSSTRLRHAEASGVDEVAAPMVADGAGGQPRHLLSSLRQRSSVRRRSSGGNLIAERTPSALERSRAANSALATVPTSAMVSGCVTPAESCIVNDSAEAEQQEQPAFGVVLVSCAPTPDLSTWFGQLRMPMGEMVPLGIDQFIPRGCVIRNTDWVLGAVVYTGRHTKMLLNLRPKPNKITTMTRRLNQLNVFLFVLNQLLMFMLCGLAIWNKHHLLRRPSGAKTEFAAWYIQWSLNRYSDAALFWWRYLTNFVLLSYLIPMSLYVTLEFNKAMQMLMIGADKRMAVYDEFTGAIKKARPKTSELNSQLGHVRYIFTDKTGTLTENLMTYVGGVVDGHTHSETEQPGAIGRALLRRRAGSGGSRGNNTSNTTSNVYNPNASGSGAGPVRRVLSMSSSGGEDTYHHDRGGVPPQRSLTAAAAGANQSTIPADGGEAPSATATDTANAAAAVSAGEGRAVQPTSSGAVPTSVTYRMPPALANIKAPPMARASPPSLAGLTRPSGISIGSGAGGSGGGGAVQQQLEHPRVNSVDVPTLFADYGSGSPMPAVRAAGTPVVPAHTRGGSSVGLLLPSSSKSYHHGVPSGSAYAWGSGTFSGFGSYNGAYLSMTGGNLSGGGAGGTGGLSKVSEAVLERDPLFRYLRALALCHSVVCFPIHGQSSVSSESVDNESLNRTAEDVEVPGDAQDDAAAKLTKAQRKQRRRERKAQRKAEKAARKRMKKDNREAGDAASLSRPHHHHHRTREEKEEEGQTGQDEKVAKKSPQQEHHEKSAQAHHHREAAGHDTAEAAGTHLSAIANTLSLSTISAANFVEIPYAVPAGPARDDFEPFHRSTTDASAGGGNGREEPLTAASSLSLTARAANARSGAGGSSTSFPPTPPPPPQRAAQHTDDFPLSPRAISKLHGRTSSASWYQNRYLSRVMHSRNFSQNSALGPQRPRAVNSGSPNSLAGERSRGFRDGVSSPSADGGGAGPGVGVGGGGGGDLEQFIDRTKIYEGQSLDEIALVNAARENGFSLFERTAKQMYLKALGRLMCYDIIAELEFTPQRKLMSILLQRRPDLDTEGAATSAAAGTSAHYHRKTQDNIVADEQAAAEAASLLFNCRGNMNTSSANNNASASFQAALQQHSSSPNATSLARDAAHSPFTPDASVLETSMNDPKRADTRHLPYATSSSFSTELLPSNGAGQPPQPKPVSQPPRTLRSPDKSGAALQHATSSNVFTPDPPIRQQSQNSPSEVAALCNTAGTGAAAASDSHKFLLLVKGADNSMMEIVNMQKKANARVKEKMLAELDAMAQLGLRTLVLGQRYLNEEEVLAWLPLFNEAQCAMHDRNDRLHQAYALLEKDVDIVGTTAVEDKLQDEVPQTLEFCIQASIVVWMLTGDKRETAVTIAHTSGLVSPDYAEYVCHLDVSDIMEEEKLLKQQKQYEEQARAKKANGEQEEGGESSEEEEGVSVSNSRMSALASPPFNTTTHNASGSIEVSSATQPLPLLSSGARSPGPQSARTAAGEADGGVLRKSDPAATTNTAASAHALQTDEAFLARKVARIEAQLAAAEAKCDDSDEVFNTHAVVVVVDGKTLDFIFADNARAHRFFLLGSRCRSAVCCRMTPLQKAKIVRMFKRNMNAVALAIGDGANDVSMIQESSIGVGIMGLEGSQAELASDYAIPKFRFLKRLLFVHGRFSVLREAHCIVYSLYKNVIVTVGMIAYQFYSCYSGISLMDSWLLAMFSIFFCSLQPLMIGILDKDVEDELAESLPTLYPPLSREFMYFSFPYIAKWLFDGMIEGLAFFFVLMYTVGVQDNLYPHMSPALEDYGMTFFTMLVLVADFRAGTLVSYYMILFALAISLEIIAVPVIELIYSAMNNLAGSNWCVKMANELYGTSGKFWLMLFFACGVLVVITMASNMYIQLFYPWQNAGFAMRAARQSSHRVPYVHLKRELKEEYAQLLARYEALRQKQEQQGMGDEEEEEGGS